MIDAAGQAKAGQTTLYLVQAQVTNKATGIQVAGNELQIQGTTLTDLTHGDGSVWSAVLVSAPAGVNPGITPTPAQLNIAHDDTLNVLGQECKLSIMANGGTDGVVLNPDKPVSDATFCVGQDIEFSVTNLPHGVIATNFQWSLDGTFVNNVIFPSSTGASATYTNDPALLKNAVITNCWWISGGLPPITYTATVRCTLTFSNGSSPRSCTAQGQFCMVRPLPTFYAQIRDNQVRVGTNHWVNGTNFGVTWLFFGINHAPGNADVGIAWGYTNAPVMPNTTNTYGYYSITQVINNYSQQYNLITNGCMGFDTNDINGLDRSNPYGVNNGAGWTALPNFEWTDAPGVLLSNAHWLDTSNSFSSYLMFQPNSSLNPIPVPMYIVQWSWSGSATNGPWAKESGSPSCGSATTTEQFPSWTHIIANVDTSPQFMHQTNCFPEN